MTANGTLNGKHSSADRLPPHNRDAERAILGCMLRDHQAIPEIVGMVRDGDFYVDAHGKIFRAVSEIADKGKNPDVVSLAQEMTARGWLDDCGGPVYLAELWDASPSGGMFRQHCQIVHDYATRRKMIHAHADLGESAYDLGTPSVELLERAEKRIFEIAELGVGGEAVELQTALTESYHRLDARRGRGEGESSGVPTGFVDLDNLLCGFQNSELIIIGARPSIGKTSLGLNIARQAAVDENLPVLFVSLEQARVELAERLLCQQGRIDSHRLRRGYLSSQDQGDLMLAGDALGRCKFFIDDNPAQNMLRISANARRLKRRHDIRLIIIDYLQLITSEDRRASRQEQVADSSRRLKGLARELKVPVIALCQVNRGPEDRNDKRPRLSDLRESGAIEADADTVLLMHRPDGQEGCIGLIEIIVAKQRNGPTGEVSLLFVKNFMRFENNAVEHSNQGFAP